MAKQQTQPIPAILVERKERSMQRHIHMHKNLQCAMLRTWQNWDSAQANRRRITTQQQNGACNSSHHVQH